MTKKAWFGLIIGGIVIIASILLLSISNEALANLLTDTQSTDEPVDPLLHSIRSFEEILQEQQKRGTPRDTLLEAKLEMEYRIATQHAYGKTHQPTRDGLLQATPTDLVGMRLPDGIEVFPASWFIQFTGVEAVSSWRKTTPERYYLVFAGYLQKDPEQGAVLFKEPETYSFTLVLTPTRSGAVKIIQEEGTAITLEAEAGERFTFDAVQVAFVTPDGEAIPTATPQPDDQLLPGTQFPPYP